MVGWLDQLRTQVTVRSLLALATLVAALSCGGGGGSATAAATTVAAVHQQSDSASNAEVLTQFRRSLGSPPVTLAGYSTRDSLVHAWVNAINHSDRAALERLTLSRAEFAWLYYPDSPLAKPPYALDAETMWMQIRSRSDRGATRALREYDAGRLAFTGYRCEPKPMQSGALTMWNACVVTHDYNGGSLSEPLFGSIIERDGVFKFVGLSNRL